MFIKKFQSLIVCCALFILGTTKVLSQPSEIPFVKPKIDAHSYTKKRNQPRNIPQHKPDPYSPFGPQYTYSLAKSDRIIFIRAIEMVKTNESKALKLAMTAADPIVSKILVWITLQKKQNKQSFEKRVRFIQRNSNWPNMSKIIKYSEHLAANSNFSAKELIMWFEKYEPVTAAGFTALANAFQKQGDANRHQNYIERAWVHGTFSRNEETTFLQIYGKYLNKAIHSKRLDRLLWGSQTISAKRMLKRVDVKMRRLAEARIALATSSYGVDRAIMRVPAALRQNAGLTYNRLKWRRVRGRFDNAITLVSKNKDLKINNEHSRLWWKELHILARHALNNNRYKEAYEIAANHSASDALSVFEAEWLAGFIQLQFLNNPDRALQHFYRVYDAVSYPVSLSRGAYWIGRALEDGNQTDLAISWYAKGAKYGATYYGQLALQKLNPEAMELIAPEKKATINERLIFEKSDLSKALKVLAESDSKKYLRTFALASAANLPNKLYPRLTAELVAKLNRIDLGVWIARRSAQKHITLIKDGYPHPAYIDPKYSERALVLSVIRQESNFDSNAISRAGARGLMQLMPATAKVVSRRIREPYNKPNLLEDPSYNIRLGDRYLFDLNRRFKSSYAMTIAAYNAGPHRVQKWIKRFGDPRKAEVDLIDWIERIPFTETRNYVQRVLENIVLYRKKIDPDLPLSKLM